MIPPRSLIPLYLAIAVSCSPVLSPYGSRVGNARGRGDYVRFRPSPHRGVDFGKMSIGDGVVASAPGIVTGVTFTADAGWRVWIDHPGHDCRTKYAHLGKVGVAVGQRVTRGQRLGSVALFRRSGGVVHVHMELHCTVEAGGALDGPLKGTRDPMSLMSGCFDPSRSYDDLSLRLTYPIDC